MICELLTYVIISMVFLLLAVLDMAVFVTMLNFYLS